MVFCAIIINVTAGTAFEEQIRFDVLLTTFCQVLVPR